MEINEVKIGDTAYEEVGAKPQAEPAKAEIAVEEPEPIEELPAGEPVLDYKALYEEEKTKASRAEYTLYKKNKAEKIAKEAQKDSQGFVDPAEVNRMVEEQVRALTEAQRIKDSDDTIQEVLFSLSNDPDERNLILFKYENSLVKTGYSRKAITEDMREAKFLANRKKYERETSELAQAAVSKRTTSNTGDGASVQRPQPKRDYSKQFTKADLDFMSKRGWSEDRIKQAAEAKQNS